MDVSKLDVNDVEEAYEDDDKKEDEADKKEETRGNKKACFKSFDSPLSQSEAKSLAFLEHLDQFQS